jgi:hypothetical protein
MKLFLVLDRLSLDLGIVALILQLLKDLLQGKLNFAFMGLFEIGSAEAEADNLDDDDDDGPDGDSGDQPDVEVAHIDHQDVPRVALGALFLEDPQLVYGGCAGDATGQLARGLHPPHQQQQHHPIPKHNHYTTTQ